MTINILHIVLGLHIGGLETFVLDLVRKGSSDTQGFIVCLESLGDLGSKVTDIPIFSLDKSPGIQLSCVKKIRKIAEKYKIDIIHTHNEGAHFYGAIAGFLRGIPVVHTRHGIHEVDNKRKLLLERFSSVLSKKIVGVSQDISALYTAKIKVAPSKVLTILNGIDTSNFSSRNINRQTLVDDTITPDTIVIGIVARLALVKDHQTLFKACQIIAKTHSKFRLVVIGDGPERNSLEELANQLNLEDTIHFMGAKYNVVDFLNCLDIFALSSISEGISITLLEAMACELPVVATRVGGNPEVVVDKETGYLVPSTNPIAFAEKLLLLMDDVKPRRIMGMAGRIRVIENFSIKKSVSEYENCYKQVLGRKD